MLLAIGPRGGGGDGGGGGGGEGKETAGGKEEEEEEEATREREKGDRTRVWSVVEGGKPINFTMANSETVATPFLQFTEVIKV